MKPLPPVRLDEVSEADAAGLIRCNLASRAHHHPWATPFIDRPGFLAWFDRITEGALVARIARAAECGTVVGVITLGGILRGPFQNAYLGYYGMAGCGGRGLMTAGVGAMCRLAFQELGLHRLEANIQPGNAASIRLATRIGFRLEGFSPRYLQIDGVWQDHERYALLADEIR
ncbi:GNAT family N-acetyltransferase [Lichenicoccus sp.]|uniref:GNAT family N-acetyltransferase n=1 Tax=Lichenicoccus sp. TaxID=2781899 RepID=UPI003D0AE4F7